MKALHIRKQWENPNHLGLNRFEVEYEDDQGEIWWTAFITLDEAEAYKLFLQSFDEET
jgi:hypothetical protein